MTENNLDSTKSASADIDFTLSYYKPKILDAIVKIWDSKKRPDLDSIFLHISKNEASNIDKDIVQILFSKLIDSNVITVKKTKVGQQSLFLTKDAAAIPTEDNTVFISLNDGCQDATPTDPNYIDLSVTKRKDSGNTKPNPTRNHSFLSLELFNTFYDDILNINITLTTSYKISVQIKYDGKALKTKLNPSKVK